MLLSFDQNRSTGSGSRQGRQLSYCQTKPTCFSCSLNEFVNVVCARVWGRSDRLPVGLGPLLLGDLWCSVVVLPDSEVSKHFRCFEGRHSSAGCSSQFPKTNCIRQRAGRLSHMLEQPVGTFCDNKLWPYVRFDVLFVFLGTSPETYKYEVSLLPAACKFAVPELRRQQS